LNTLREQPEKAQWFSISNQNENNLNLFFSRIMRTADGTMREKIRRLVELGLLNIV